jgi:small subunit ribosomal protein S16e
MIKVNGIPLSLIQPEILRLKTLEPILVVGADKFANVCPYLLLFLHLYP